MEGPSGAAEGQGEASARLADAPMLDSRDVSAALIAGDYRAKQHQHSKHVVQLDACPRIRFRVA